MTMDELKPVEEATKGRKDETSLVPRPSSLVFTSLVLASFVGRKKPRETSLSPQDAYELVKGAGLRGSNSPICLCIALAASLASPVAKTL